MIDSARLSRILAQRRDKEVAERFWVTGKYPLETRPAFRNFSCIVDVNQYSIIVLPAHPNPVLKDFDGKDIQDLIDWGECAVEPLNEDDIPF